MLDGHQRGGRKPTETSVTELYYKRVNLSLEELRNIKMILFLIPKALLKQITPKISHSNQLGRHLNAASRKDLDIQA